MPTGILNRTLADAITRRQPVSAEGHRLKFFYATQVRQARAAETVAAILEATAQILEAGGLPALTTNAVAARAGVSIGTLYQYFDDKNAILLALFPNRGDVFVTDDGNMSMTYTFNFALSAVEAAIVTQSGVLPKPSGVAVSYVQNF